MNDVLIRGKKISQDEYGFLCLNDIWKLAGSENNKRPAQWQRLPMTKELLGAINSNVGFSHNWTETPDHSAIYTKRGHRGGTFAFIIMALAYAEYLNPDLAIEVREIALRVWAGDVSVLDDFKRAQTEQMQDDHDRILMREEMKRYNFDLNAIVKDAGGKIPLHWANFHNFGYRAQYNGLDEDGIHRLKGLKRGQAILDYMCIEELAANVFRATQARLRLRRQPAQSVLEACEVHKKAGERVRALMAEIGGVMPEDMPRVDSVSAARKRLRNYAKSRPALK